MPTPSSSEGGGTFNGGTITGDLVVNDATGASEITATQTLGPAAGLYCDATTPQVYVGDAAGNNFVYLQEAHDSQDFIKVQYGDGTRVWRVNKAGYLMLLKNAAPADGDVRTSEVAFWFDNTDGAPKLMLKGKQADATVVTAAIALA